MRLFSIILFALIFSLSGIAQECGIIYVSPNGAGGGTQAAPTSLQTALGMVAPGQDYIRLAQGVYPLNSSLNIPANTTMEGGYDPATWVKSNNASTILQRSALNPDPAPDRLVALSGNGISGFRLQDLEVEVADALGSGVSTYGIYLNGCSDYNIVRVKVTAGNGSNGVDGLPGVDGQDGADGANGQNGANCSNGPRAGGAGGNAWSGGAAAGGNGGDGGQEGDGFNANPFSGNFGPGDGYDGANGGPGVGLNPGANGIGGLEFSYAFNDPCGLFGDCGPNNGVASSGTSATDAPLDGANGINGVNGLPSHAGGFFIPGTGLTGADGENGSGGGGGGGGGSAGEGAFGNPGTGAGGGGGGEGGQGGTGATGGTGGGGSFGIYLTANGTGGIIKDCQMSSGLPGLGGIGGFPGGYGGFGGDGGDGGAQQDGGVACSGGGDGGDGSNGGDGGFGGAGAPGVSQALYEDLAGVPASQINLNANVEPEVTLDNTGCTYSDILFNTNAFGIIEWFYEGGTNPSTSLGNDVTIQYYNGGFHGVTMVSNGVPYQLSNFVNIFQDGTPFLPTIIPSPDTICPGQTVNFSATWPTAFSVLGYRWDFGDPNSGGSNTSTSPNPSHTYNDVGTYLVQLQTESPCCGWSAIDSNYIEVLPNVTPEVFITVTDNEICEGEIVTFGAVPAFGGPNPTFEWFLNNVSSGVGPSYTPGPLSDGDEVYVQMTSSYPCPPNAMVNSQIMVMIVHPLPVVDCSNVANTYLGATTIFNPLVTVGTAPYDFAWQFGDGGFSTDSVALHEYGSTGFYDASLEVTDDFGCSTTCDVQVEIVLPPYVDAGFTWQITQDCGQTTVQFTDTSTGNPIFWNWYFGDGSQSDIANPLVTFTGTGPYSVMLVASNSVFSDTIIIPNLIEVWEIPTASFYADEVQVCDSVAIRFYDESINAVEWVWDFGDPAGNFPNSSDLQNPSHTYSDPGTYSVTMTAISDSGCTADAPPIQIIVYETPNAKFEVDSPVCTDVPIIFHDQSFDDFDITNWYYRWSKDGAEEEFFGVDEYPHVFEEPGWFHVTQFVRNELTGCQDSALKVVEVRPHPVASFYPEMDEMWQPDSTMNFWNNSDFIVDDSSHWDFGNGYVVEWQRDAVGIYPDSGLFDVTLSVSNELGCRDDTIIPFRVWEQETFFIASAFTPNGDGINDIFDIKEKGIVGWEWTIYDRWGKLVWQSTNVRESWDGKNMFSGLEMPSGGYAYYIKLQWYTGREFEKIGTITLYR